MQRRLGVTHMASPQMQEPRRTTGGTATVGRLFLLDLSDDRVVSLNADGSDRKIIVTGCQIPRWHRGRCHGGTHLLDQHGRSQRRTTAPSSEPTSTGGTARRSFPQGGTFTPKQLQLEKKSGKLYWCDREGMRVMRANLDGSNIETARGHEPGRCAPGPDATKWCVGMAVDADRGQIYWTQKGPDNAGKGRIFRAGIDIPNGQTASNRADIEVLYRRAARADRSGARSQQSRHVLDRPGRSTPRQHGEPCANGLGSRTAAPNRKSCSRT